MPYPRSLTSETKPFNPIEVSIETEKRAIRGNKRRYRIFRVEPFYRQIATARGVGCNLRCAFCWVSPSRDYPEDHGEFHTPQEVYNKLVQISSNEHGRAIMSEAIRISGCEPTIGREHLLSLIETCKKGGDFKPFLLETNGILLGHDETYVKSLKEFGNYILVRVSFKAGTPEAFERKTGARAEFFTLPFQALQHLRKHQIPYHFASMSQDPTLMPPEERRSLLEQIILQGAENMSLLDEEKSDPFEITIRRLLERRILTDPKNLRAEVYEPLQKSIERVLARRTKGSNPITQEELIEIIRTMKMRILESNCISCTNDNPWCSHITKHDSSPLLI